MLFKMPNKDIETWQDNIDLKLSLAIDIWEFEKHLLILV